ncbi:MAG: pyrroline-5-carboxylate reductase [Pirellulaceae bacterium]
MVDSRRTQGITLVGGGKMGRALVQGMIASGFTSASNISLSEPNPQACDWWRRNLPEIRILDEKGPIADDAEVALIAVKPAIVATVLQRIKQEGHQPLVVSIAAGITLQTMIDAVGYARVVRVMPNTPSLVGAGASAYCCGQEIDSSDAELVENMLTSVGIVQRVDEKWMDAITGLSGSGPAFVCMVIEALADGGVLAGLSRDVAMQFATQTVMGTAKLVQQTGTHPAELKDAVASPGGTTIAGIAAAEQAGLRSALISAVHAAAKRSRELG